MPRFFALWLTLGLALPNPAGASPELSRRTLRARGADNPEVQAGLEAALRPETAPSPILAAGAEAEETRIQKAREGAHQERVPELGRTITVYDGILSTSDSGGKLLREYILANPGEFQNQRVWEIGPGQAASTLLLLRAKPKELVATNLLPEAIANTEENRAGESAEVLQVPFRLGVSDLDQNLPQIAGETDPQFDRIVFLWPGTLRPGDRTTSVQYVAAYRAGYPQDPSNVIRRATDVFSRRLKPGGKAYVFSGVDEPVANPDYVNTEFIRSLLPPENRWKIEPVGRKYFSDSLGVTFSIVRITRLAAGAEARPKELRHDGSVYSVSYSRDKRFRMLVTAGTDGKAYLWNQDSGIPLFGQPKKGLLFGTPIKVDSPILVATPRAEHRGIFVVTPSFAATYEFSTAILQKDPGPMTFSRPFKLSPEGYYAGRLALSPGRTSMAVIEDGAAEVVIQNLAPERKSEGLPIQIMARLKPRQGRPTSVAYRPVSRSHSKDGQVVAVGTDQGAVELWTVHRVPRGQEAFRTKTVFNHDEGAGIVGLAFAPDGNSFASADDRGEIRLWLPKGNNLGRRFVSLRHSVKEKIHALVFSPDGKYLASAGESGEIYLWGVETGGHRIIAAEEGPVTTLVFQPDSKEIAAATSRPEKGGRVTQLVRIWKTAAGAEQDVEAARGQLFDFIRAIQKDLKTFAASRGSQKDKVFDLPKYYTERINAEELRRAGFTLGKAQMVPSAVYMATPVQDPSQPAPLLKTMYVDPDMQWADQISKQMQLDPSILLVTGPEGYRTAQIVVSDKDRRFNREKQILIHVTSERAAASVQRGLIAYLDLSGKKPLAVPGGVVLLYTGELGEDVLLFA